MQNNHPASLPFGLEDDARPEPKEIVMGLHWDPPEDGTKADSHDLDALCALLDRRLRVLEVIHPGHSRNANGSVIHTGDSQTGTSEWDDERIFVFLEALPATVSALSFVVSSAKGRAFSEVHGASCHVSDRLTEYAWVQLELTALRECSAYCVATLHRNTTGWSLSTDARTLQPELLTEVLSRIKDAKT